MKRWLRDILFSDEEQAREVGAVRIVRGKLPEEKAEFWRRIRDVLDSEPGRAYQALMQQALERLAMQMLSSKSDEERKDAFFRWKQQTWVCEYSSYIEGQIQRWTKK